MVNRTRNATLMLRMTDEEKELIKKQMAKAGSRNITDFILKSVCYHRTTVIDTQPLMQILGEINKIGVNINQIAKVANTSRSIHYDEVKNLSSECDKLRKIVCECFYAFCDAKEGKLDGIYEDSPDQNLYTSSDLV